MNAQGTRVSVAEKRVSPLLAGFGLHWPWWTGAGVMVSMLAVACSFAPEELPPVAMCWFRELTGLPCAGCGLTRGVCAIGHGQFVRAWEFNPFAFAVWGAALTFLAEPLARRMWPKGWARFWSAEGRLVPPVVFVGLVVFGVVRLLGAIG